MIYIKEFFDFNNTGYINLRMTQSFIDKNKVNEIKKSMESNTYDYDLDDNRIGIEIYNNVYYVSEGHHRMQAALEMWKSTGDYTPVENLVKKAVCYDIKYKPVNYRFNI